MQESKPISKIEKKESTYRKLSEQEIKKVLFLSYMMSQGQPNFQSHILNFVHDYYGDQEGMDIARAEEDIARNMSQLSSKHVHKDLKAGNKEELENVSRYLDVLKGDIFYEYSLNDFYTKILDSDDRYLRLGRPNRLSTNEGDNTIKDKYFSFTIHYLIRKNKLGEEAFDFLLKTLREIMLKSIKPETLVYNPLLHIVVKYNETHPNTKVTIEELAEIGINSEVVSSILG
jgi:hypothetical protein